MGKWSGLKGTLEPAPVDLAFQNKVDAAKAELLGSGNASLGQAFCKLRDEKDELEERIKVLNIQLEAISQMMVKGLEGDGMDSFRLNTGDLLSIKDEPYTSIANKAEFIKWIRDTGQEDLLTVHYMTMNAMSKERLQNGQPLPPGLKAFIRQSITRRRGHA